MNELAKKLIKDHKNPVTKVDLPGTKLFLKSSTSEETQFIETHQSNLEHILRYERAERRCARSRAEWSPEKKLAKATRVVKTMLNHFGYQDKSGIFLYVEEMLFLMETNRLEVTQNDVPLSIQEGYYLLAADECNLKKYRVYKKLVLLGYKVLRYAELLRRQLKNKNKVDEIIYSEQVINNGLKSNPTHQKRTIEECGEFEKEPKKLFTETEVENSNAEISEIKFEATGSKTNNKEIHFQYIKDVFEKLRTNAPKEYKPSFSNSEVPDYCIFLPSNKSRCNYDFNLFICDGPILKRKNPQNTVPAIYAICSDDNISFYKFSTVNLPLL